MSTNDRLQRERGRDLARRFVALVAEIVTAPAQTRHAFNEVMDELGPWPGVGGVYRAGDAPAGP